MTDTPVRKRARAISFVTTWTLRVLIALTIFFFLSLMVAALLGGNGEPQKKSLENIFGDFVGYPTRIHTLHNYELFPLMKVDITGISSTDKDDQPVLIMETLRYVHDPLQRYTGGYPLIDVYFSNLLTAPGFIGPYSIHLQELKVDEATSTATGTGNYGGHAFTLTIRLESAGEGASRRYRVLAGSPIEVKFNDLKITFLMSIAKEQIVFENLELSSTAGKLSGTMIVPSINRETPLSFSLTADTGATIEGKIPVFGKAMAVDIQSVNNPDKTDLAARLRPLLDLMLTTTQKDPAGKQLPVGDLTLTVAGRETCTLTNKDLRHDRKDALARCLD